MKSRATFYLVLGLLAIPLVYLAYVYPLLPTQVATHFTLDGKPDAYSSKEKFPFFIAMMIVIALLCYLLLTNLQRIDPKRTQGQSPETMRRLGVAIVVLLTTITLFIIYSAVNHTFHFSKIILPVLGLFFAFVGNLMISIKPNYFLGIRTPWALEDHDNWRQTHQLAGKLWFVGGILIVVLSAALPGKYAVIVMLIITAIISIIPAYYSYRYFQLHKKNDKLA